MAFSKDVYRELEDIVGSENISSDLAVLDRHTFTGTYELRSIDARYQRRPEAVVLPGSTKEVQIARENKELLDGDLIGVEKGHLFGELFPHTLR
jgi:hypothetical protein